MRLGEISVDAVTAVLDPELCVGCGACASGCPFDAIEWLPSGEPHVVEAACKGCGVCTVECPVGAMQLRYFKDSQLVPAVRALMHQAQPLEVEEVQNPTVLVFACRWCSYAAADFAGVMRLSYPANVRILMVPCSGRVDFRHIYEGFSSGADGVIVTGCLKEQCHYVDGNLVAERRVEAAKKAIEVLGVSGDRLEMFFCSAGMPREFSEYMQGFTERIQRLGKIERDTVRAFRETEVEAVAGR
jgi:heterodisulfide reductase subunit A